MFLQLSYPVVIATVIVISMAIVAFPAGRVDVLPAIPVTDFIVSRAVLQVGSVTVIIVIINIQIVQQEIGHIVVMAITNTAATIIMSREDGLVKDVPAAPATAVRVPGQPLNIAAVAITNTAATATMSREGGLSRAAQELLVTKVLAIGG